MAYQRISDDTVIDTEAKVKVYNIPELEKQIEEKKVVLNQKEPSDEDLIAFAKINHPFFFDRLMLEMEIQQLESLVTELKAV